MNVLEPCRLPGTSHTAKFLACSAQRSALSKLRFLKLLIGNWQNWAGLPAAAHLPARAVQISARRRARAIPAEPLGLVQELNGPCAVVLLRNLDLRANQNRAEPVTEFRPFDSALRFHLQVGVFKLRIFRESPKRGRVATGDRAEEQILSRPPAVQATKRGRSREMNGIGRRIGFCESRPARGPPGNYTKRMHFCRVRCGLHGYPGFRS